LAFSWSNAETTEDLSNLTSGNYSVTVTDASGCSVTATATVGEPTALTANAVGSDVTCNGAGNGSVNLTASGGTGTLSFAWSNAATTEDLSGLAAGTYTVTVTDANGCSATASTGITQPSAVTASGTATTASCGGGNDASIDLTVSNAQGVTTFSWSNGTTVEDPSGLAAGTYTVTVTDANGCSTTASVAVTSNDAVAPVITCPSNISVSNDAGICGAAVTFSASATDNCSATVTYSHASGSTFGIGTTTVTATATDPGGNTATCSFTVTVSDNEAPEVTCPTQVIGTVMPGAATGTATFTSTVTDNCSATVSYSHVSGSSFPVGSTTVTVTATDPSGNTSVCSFNVVIPRYLYVDQTATGSGNGSNWANAFLTLQSAITASVAGRDTILVAGGTYSPGPAAGNTYTLKARVPLYGGFPNGLHPSLWSFAQRDPAVNATILNGGNVNNRVLTVRNYGIDPELCVIDGFTVQGAKAGGLYIEARGATAFSCPIVRNCRFLNNTGSVGGGTYANALGGGAAFISFTDCLFSGNVATSTGGGAYAIAQTGGTMDATFTNCTFSNNAANHPTTTAARGGALGLMSSGGTSSLSAALIGCTFENNSSEQWGGAVYTNARTGSSNNITFTSCTFTGNSGNSGGAIHNYAQSNSTISVTGTTFTNNAATFSGGAIRNYCELNSTTGTISLTGCTFTDNECAGTGGAVSNVALKGAAAQMIMDRCRFDDNTSTLRGGAIFAQAVTRSATYPNTNAYTSVTNSLFLGNTSSQRGGAVYNEGTSNAPSTIVVTNSTFASNTAQVGGAYFGMAGPGTASATANVTNSIFWNNTTSDTTSRTFHNNAINSTISILSSSLQSSTFVDNETGVGTFVDQGSNIGGDPLFVNLGLGDLHLEAFSPCVDGGINVAFTLDFDGNARSQGAGVDLGAFETAGPGRPMARQPQTTVATAPTATLYPNPTTGAFTVALDREVTGFAQVFDVQGRLVASEQLNGANQAQFDLGTVATGMYLVRIVDGETVITKQLVVTRP
jgi:predicted outer membrane repeat protein